MLEEITTRLHAPETERVVNPVLIIVFPTICMFAKVEPKLNRSTVLEFIAETLTAPVMVTSPSKLFPVIVLSINDPPNVTLPLPVPNDNLLSLIVPSLKSPVITQLKYVMFEEITTLSDAPVIVKFVRT